MNPLMLTIAAALCLAGAFQGRDTEISARHPTAIEEPDSPANAIALNLGADVVKASRERVAAHA